MNIDEGCKVCMISRLNEKYKYITQCERCGCILSFEDEDIKVSSHCGIKYLNCPICRREIRFGVRDFILTDIVGRGVSGFGYYREDIWENQEEIRSQIVKESPQ